MRRPFRTSFSELVDRNKQDLEQDEQLLDEIEERIENRRLHRLKKRNTMKKEAAL